MTRGEVRERRGPRGAARAAVLDGWRPHVDEEQRRRIDGAAERIHRTLEHDKRIEVQEVR